MNHNQYREIAEDYAFMAAGLNLDALATALETANNQGHATNLDARIANVYYAAVKHGLLK